MHYIILLIKKDSLGINSNNLGNNIISSYWFWISIIEFALIIILIYKLNKKNQILGFTEIEKNSLEYAKDQSIDMNNLMNSISGASILYKELSRKYHPDRFVNSPKHKIAEEIFKEISKNKRNYENLNLLKNKAIKELNIN